MRNDLLLALRTQRGWTQEELSERSGISVRTIRNLERGRIQSPRRSSLDLLFSVLDPELRGKGDQAAPVPRRASGSASGSAGPAGPVGAPGAAPGTSGGPWARWRGPRPPRTALVGRDGDLDRLTELVTGNPVTVLTGPGGVGKTRLALAVAERVASVSRGTVGVVQLGRIAAGPPGEGAAALTAARHAVAEVLGEDHRPPGSASGQGLLVLDTTEHLPQATALLVEHLRGAWPDLRLVLTTRRPPVLPEARIWETAPLGQDAAVQLMNRRLASSALDHDLTGAPDLVRALCRELDGVPRLIEFAAHRLRTVPITTLLSPEHLLELLGIPDFSVQPHQRSLRGSLEWSWAMLTQRQRQFMVRLAAAPDCVASDGQELGGWEPEFTRTEALCLLAELADASFLQVRRGPRYEYRMLRHVRAFVRHHQLRAAPQAPVQVRRMTAGA
ncbi:helix-turn-helix domain-containing protein [Streptomyces sp. HPF1205]|uniref:helix-turn-helix domain-containing protein n=1 Tax=Streptomyces sp. HPF1205 TaxID=2873262 RepID=UPI001CEC0EA9|nr:helix-turn-helix domain-containing protein [Streptomyces sp. HPF1205]